MKTISIDTETTGIDFKHGARPYFVTTCDEEGQQKWFEWDVNPRTREVLPDAQDLEAIQELLYSVDRVVFQNGKFDIRALQHFGIKSDDEFLRTSVEDTLFAGHVLASNQPHDLTSMVSTYVGVDIQPFEDKLKEACVAARKIARKEFPAWRIAKEGEADMPSIKGISENKKKKSGRDEDKPWKFDAWLPRAIVFAKAKENGVICYNLNDPWITVLSNYANADSASTFFLWRAMEKELKNRGLWKIYREQMKLLPVLIKMEERGVTAIKDSLYSIEAKMVKDRDSCANKCLEIAHRHKYNLELPKGASPNNSLKAFLFNHLKTPVIKYTDGGKQSEPRPSLDKEVLENYQLMLEGEALEFITALRRKRKRDTALSFIESYKRFWLPTSNSDIMVLYPSINPTTTATLRFSMSNPNGQQVSKQEAFCEQCKGEGCNQCDNSGYDLKSLRHCFGPACGREWYCLDHENLELRIPAYKAGEKAMIELFEKPDEPPYFGSNHLLFFDILHHEKFVQPFCPKCLGGGCRDDSGKRVKCQPAIPLYLIKGGIKKLYGATWYQWTKNGDFAVQYGAVAESGTADRSYHVEGAQAKIESHLSRIKEFSNSKIAEANKYGYVQVEPDQDVDPEHGYPLLVSRSMWGGVKPTQPLSYYVQGTAMQCTRKAMIRCDLQLEEWNQDEVERYYMVLQVHDELVFDFPAYGPKRNMPKVRKLQALMEQSGEDIGVPLKVAITYCPKTWGDGKSIQ